MSYVMIGAAQLDEKAASPSLMPMYSDKVLAPPASTTMLPAYSDKVPTAPSGSGMSVLTWGEGTIAPSPPSGKDSSKDWVNRQVIVAPMAKDQVWAPAPAGTRMIEISPTDGVVPRTAQPPLLPLPPPLVDTSAAEGLPWWAIPAGLLVLWKVVSK